MGNEAWAIAPIHPLPHCPIAITRHVFGKRVSYS